MSAALNVIAAYLVNWVVRGEFHVDTQYYDTIWFVMVELADGRHLCHNVSFNIKEEAQTLASRVESRGVIDEQYWYEHEFFSKTLEERLTEEAHHENLFHTGRGEESNSRWFSAGHA